MKIKKYFEKIIIKIISLKDKILLPVFFKSFRLMSERQRHKVVLHFEFIDNFEKILKNI